MIETELDTFKSRAETWLAQNIPLTEDAPVHDSDAERVAYEKSTQIKIYDAGFGAISWPEEYGGQGLSQAEEMIWQQVGTRYALPRRAFAVSHGMCGPIINHLGTEEQKRQHLPKLWRGDTIWCQLFSEPSAGSDIAGLQTKAVRVPGGWKISGQKVWTSVAQWCDYGVLVARTDPSVPKHEGMTMFLINMKDPAVTVRPLRVANAEEPFNEVFFDDLIIQDSDVLGEVNEGWSAAVAMLGFERISIGTTSTPSATPYSYQYLARSAASEGTLSRPDVQEALAEVYVLEAGVRDLSDRMREEADAGIDIGPRGSIAKLASAVFGYRMGDLIDRVVGPSLVSWRGDELPYPDLTREFISAPGYWIAGGTMEIQKNIIGERILGLEKEPQVDRKIPFNQIRRGI